MDLLTAFLVLPFLSSPPSEGLPRLIEDLPKRTADESAVTILRELPKLAGAEQEIARFLLAVNLAELGLEDVARTLYRPLLTSKLLAGPAFVGLARIQSEAEENDLLYHAAKTAPWERLEDDDFAEAAYRVARASFQTGRFPEAREWARQIGKRSPYFPFARYLLAQSEYALGRYGRAVEAAEAVFSAREPAAAIRRLQDRTAVLLGDMLIEIGLYQHAIDVLSWPSPESPFRDRARRDLLIARGLAALELARFDRGEADTENAGIWLERLGDEIEASVGSDGGAADRVADLKRAWPPKVMLTARRQWAARRASAALDDARGWGVRRALSVVWASLPPVVIYRLVRHEKETAPRAVAIASETRFFFAPRPRLSRVLTAVALAEAKRHGRSCRARAAESLRSRAAAALLEERRAPSLVELSELAGRCGERPIHGLGSRAGKRLRAAIEGEARSLRRELRLHRFALDEAVARARLEHQAAARAVEMKR